MLDGFLSDLEIVCENNTSQSWYIHPHTDYISVFWIRDRMESVRVWWKWYFVVFLLTRIVIIGFTIVIKNPHSLLTELLYWFCCSARGKGRIPHVLWEQPSQESPKFVKEYAVSSRCIVEQTIWLHMLLWTIRQTRGEKVNNICWHKGSIPTWFEFSGFVTGLSQLHNVLHISYVTLGGSCRTRTAQCYHSSVTSNTWDYSASRTV